MFKKILISTILITSIFLFTSCGTSKGEYKEISYKELKEKLDNKEDFILEFMRDDCPHCTKLAPTLEKVTTENNVIIYYINTNTMTEKESLELNGLINVSGTPTIVFIKKGEEESTLNRLIGAVSEEKIISKFKSNGFLK